MKDLSYYMSLNYMTVVILDECTDGTYTYLAQHPELPGCMSDGETDQEAIENLADARQMYIEDLLSRGMVPPNPVSFNAIRTAIHADEHAVEIAEVEPPPLTWVDTELKNKREIVHA
jgi:predicted RNase H-like HicB family nuclease